MNQPKYKFGDKVQYSQKPSVAFIVEKIVHSKSGRIGFYYGCNDGFPSSHEDDLEPYQEPQKKKLYAWESPDGVIFHTKSEAVGIEVFYRLKMNGNGFARATDWDIEFPEAK